VTPSSF